MAPPEMKWHPEYSLEEIAGRGFVSKRKEGDSARAIRASARASTSVPTRPPSLVKEDSSRAFALLRRISRGGASEGPAQDAAEDTEMGLRQGEMKKALSLFFSGVTGKEMKLLFGDKEEITEKDIMELLEENEVSFDPVREVFKILAPERGSIGVERLRSLVEVTGSGEMSKSEEERLLTLMDEDGDGKMGIEDFRRMAGERE